MTSTIGFTCIGYDAAAPSLEDLDVVLAKSLRTCDRNFRAAPVRAL